MPPQLIYYQQANYATLSGEWRVIETHVSRLVRSAIATVCLEEPRAPIGSEVGIVTKLFCRYETYALDCEITNALKLGTEEPLQCDRVFIMVFFQPVASTIGPGWFGIVVLGKGSPC